MRHGALQPAPGAGRRRVRPPRRGVPPLARLGLLQELASVMTSISPPKVTVAVLRAFRVWQEHSRPPRHPHHDPDPDPLPAATACRQTRTAAERAAPALTES